MHFFVSNLRIGKEGERNLKYKPICPMENTLDMVSGRYKILILYYLSQGKMRYGDLQRKLSMASAKVLTEQLRKLEDDKLIERIVYPETPPHVEYRLTAISEKLHPVFKALYEWGQEYEAKIKSDRYS